MLSCLLNLTALLRFCREGSDPVGTLQSVLRIRPRMRILSDHRESKDSSPSLLALRPAPSATSPDLPSPLPRCDFQMCAPHPGCTCGTFRRCDLQTRPFSYHHRNLFRINTCKSVSKQTTLTSFGMNTYKKHRGEGTPLGLPISPLQRPRLSAELYFDSPPFREVFHEN